MAPSRKRDLAVKDFELEESKKAKTAHAQKEESNRPPVPLYISSMSWRGCPTAYCVEESKPEVHGEYDFSTTKQRTKLVPDGWSAEHEAHVYKLNQPHALRYNRESYMGQNSSSMTDYGAVWGNPTPNPLVFLHREEYFHPKFIGDKEQLDCESDSEGSDADGAGEDGSDGDGRSTSEAADRGPPYRFLTTGDSENGFDFEGPYAKIEMPDTLAHHTARERLRVEDPSKLDPTSSKYGPDSDSLESEDLPSDAEEDFGEWTGFEGRWTRDFIAEASGGQQGGSLEKVVWGCPEINAIPGATYPGPYSTTREALWGFRVKVEPVARSIVSKEVLGKERLGRYGVLASILEVYIKPEFFSE